MSPALRLPSFLAAPPVDVAIELAADRVSVARLGVGARGPALSAFGTVALPAGAVTPALVGQNVADPEAVAAALTRAFDLAGLKPPRRAALVVPDSVARVSLLTFETLPSRAADVDQLVRWQLRKSVPFAVDDAQVSHTVVPGAPGQTTLVAIIARREAVAEYEAVTARLGVQAGLVELASLNVANMVCASTPVADGGTPAGADPDWLLVHLASEATTLAIFRGGTLVFYRHRSAADTEPLGALVHQTAMYYEDRLGGGRFAAVRLAGAAGAAAEPARAEVAERLKIAVEPVDPRAAVAIGDRAATPETLDAMTAVVGVLLRERRAA